MTAHRTNLHRRFVIIGAGPYGLAIGAKLRAAGVDFVTFGRAMSFWKEQVPRGTSLLSDPDACSLSNDELSIEAWDRSRGATSKRPFQAEEFIQYCLWFQVNACPEVDQRTVISVDRRDKEYEICLNDGDKITADHVVVAIGLQAFALRPPEFAALPIGLACHSSDLYDLSGFQGKKVAVIGSGQGALECAALLSEQNADVEILARASGIRWRPYGGHRRQPSGSVESYLRSAVRLTLNNPAVFRRLPRFARDRWLRRTLRTAADSELRPRLESVRVKLDCKLNAAFADGDGIRLQFGDGMTRKFDRVVFGTGYRIDVNAIPFLAPELRRRIAHHNGYPELNSVMESTVRRLYFAGAPAALNFGTDMWFVHGAPVAAEHISRVLRRRQPFWSSAVAEKARAAVSPGSSSAALNADAQPPELSNTAGPVPLRRIR